MWCCVARQSFGHWNRGVILTKLLCWLCLLHKGSSLLTDKRSYKFPVGSLFRILQGWLCNPSVKFSTQHAFNFQVGQIPTQSKCIDFGSEDTISWSDLIDAELFVLPHHQNNTGESGICLTFALFTELLENDVLSARREHREMLKKLGREFFCVYQFSLVSGHVPGPQSFVPCEEGLFLDR